MKRFGNVILKKWYWFLFAAVVLGEAAVFLFFGEGSYIATHDNLDLFMGHIPGYEALGRVHLPTMLRCRYWAVSLGTI